MSVIPFTTQIGPHSLNASSSQAYEKFVLIYTDKMTERQSALMKECQHYLSQNLEIVIKKANEIQYLPKYMRFFVIPNLRDDLVKKIDDYFEKPRIYLPRAVIEARGHSQVDLPVRSLAISMTMYSCQIFLVKNCNLSDIRDKIYSMAGLVAKNFSDTNINVVVVDKADNKYCAKAHKRNIPVVSRKWVDDNYMAAMEEESGFFNKNALETIGDYRIRPFFGLHFKINAGAAGFHVKKLITDNQGHIIYGNENCLTHVVRHPNHDMPESDEQSGSISSQKPKYVDEEFLKTCVESGYYVPKRDYHHTKISTDVIAVKQERLSPENFHAQTEKNYMPMETNEGCLSINENQAILRPPQISSPLRQQPDNMNDIIIKALAEPAQTQLAFTQMRRLPDPELRIERTYEPSQQLYWNDNACRRN